MCDNSRECQAARRHGFVGRPRFRTEVPEETSVRPPASVVERLGIRPGMRVALVGVGDEGITSVVREATPNVTAMLPRDPVDIVIYQSDGVFALRRIAELVRSVHRTGALWVLWPRDDSGIAQSHVRRAGRDAGLADVMVARLSDHLSGFKFVYRLKDR